MAVINSKFSVNIDAVAYKFIGVATGATTTRWSEEGQLWTAGGALASASGWSGLAYGNDTVVAVANSANTANMVNTSVDGINWTQRTVSATGTASVGWFDVAFGAGVFVMTTGGISNSVQFRYSTDGINWNNTTGVPTGDWRCIVWAGTRFVALSFGSNATCYSADGITWTTGPTLPSSSNWIDVEYDASLGILVAISNSSGTVAASSTNPTVSWTSRTLPTTATWKAVTTNGSGRFVAIANNANSVIGAISTDGTNWTAMTLPVAATWNCISYGGPGYYSLTSTGSTNYAYSTDGINWALIAQVSAAWNATCWAPIDWRTNDTLTINNAATVTVNTNQQRFWSGITINNGTLNITNSSTSTAIRFTTGRTSGASAQAITPASGLGVINVQGNWIQVGTGDNSSNQAMTVPYTDYVSALWVETAAGSNTYEIWLNVSGAYSGTLRQYADGLLDVSTGSRGKFFRQTPATNQDVYLGVTGNTTLGSFTITGSDTTNIKPGASITGKGIPANTVVENIINSTSFKINQVATATNTNVGFLLFNPYSAQFTNQVVFGDGVNGNKVPTGAKVRVPNIMLTSDTPANLHTSNSQLGMSFVLTSGGRVNLDTCLFDEAYHNLNQTQSLTITNVGLHIPPAITEVYSLNINGFGIGMTPTRRFNSSNVWSSRDLRDGLTNPLSMNFISGAIINNLAIVCQSTHAITAGTINAAQGVLRIDNSDSITVSNVRLYALNATRTYQVGLNFTAPVTNSTFTDIEFYGGPMMNVQLSSSNTFRRLTNSESMFAYSHNYTAGMRVNYDPNTNANMVENTKYYFKSRTYFTRDRQLFTESRVYSATPFKASTLFPDYITAYLNAPQSVLFGWTHRTPIYTADTSPLSNASAKNFIEIHRGTTPGFTKTLATKVAGLNTGLTVSCPTVVTWATDTRTIAFTNNVVTASGGRTLTFNASAKTITASSGDFTTSFQVGDEIIVAGTTSNNTNILITGLTSTVITTTDTLVNEGPLSATATLTVNRITASSGSFITDGYLVGDNVTVLGSTGGLNNNEFTIIGITATTLTVSQTLVTQTAMNTKVYLVGKYKATPKIVLTASAGRTLKFDGLSLSASGRAMTFNASARTITAASGSFVTDNVQVGDKILVSGTSFNNTGNFYLTVTSVVALTLTFTGDVLYDEVSSTTAVLTINKLTASSGSFITDGYAVGDKIVASGFGTAGNNKTYTLINVTALYLNFAESVTTQVAETATATLTTFNQPVPKVVFANASSNFPMKFDRIVSSAAATTRIMTFNKANKTITLSGTLVGTAAGNFLSDGFVVGDKVVVTGTTLNNKFTLTVTAVTATVLTFSNTTEQMFDETSTTAVLTTNKLTRGRVDYVAQAVTTVRLFTFASAGKTITASGTTPGSFTTDGFAVGDTVVITNSSSNNGTYTISALTATVMTVNETLVNENNSTTATITSRNKISTTTGSFITDGFVVGDTITVTGSTSGTNDGTFTISNVTAFQLNLNETVTTQNIQKTGLVITANKLLSRQLVYITSTRTCTVAGGKTFTFSSGSLLQDGYIVGDKVLVNGSASNNWIFTVSALTATVMTVLETTVAETSSTNTITWTHTGQRPSVTSAASPTISVTAGTKTFTLSAGSWDATYGFQVGDKIFISGQLYNNGVFTIASITTSAMVVTEAVIADATVYNNTTVCTIVGWHPTQKTSITASGGRTIAFSQSAKTITASSGSFILDGYNVGDAIQVTGTAGGLNDGYFTISLITATVITVNELLVTQAAVSSTVNISAPNIAHNTDYYYVLRKYDSTGTFNDSAEIYVKSTYQNALTNLALQSTSLITSWTASGITVGAATRISPYVGFTATQTADAKILTSTAANGTLTQSIPTAVGNSYTFSIWVATQPTISKIAAITASATRGWVFKNLTLTATGGRTLQFTSGTNTITASSGSFTTDTWIVGDKFKITGTASNNGTFTVATVGTTTMTVTEALVNEGPLSSGATLTLNKLTTNGTTPGSWLTDGYVAGDKVISNSTNNNGIFTIFNVQATIMFFDETVVNETITATNTLGGWYPNTMTIPGSISLGTNTTSFTARADWQLVSVTFTATGTTTNAVLTITNTARVLVALGASVVTGSSTKPMLTTTTTPVAIANEVRDINLVRAWCRGYGEAATHSGIEIQLASSVTGELWTEVYCGTTAGFTPSQSNKIFDTFVGSGNTLHFNNASQNNLLDTFTQATKGAATNYFFAYFAAVSSGNRLKNVTYDLSGVISTGLATFLTQSNNMTFYNWNIKGWRNYATTVGNVMLFPTTNATSGLVVENLIMDNSDLPLNNAGLGMLLKGVSGGNIKPLNSALFNNMPVTPVFTIPGGAPLTTNFDGISAATTSTNYTTVYDTIFNEMYFTSTTGALALTFNASAKTVKPYSLTGTAAFSNQGRLYFNSANDSATYTWPHKIIGVSGFRNLAPLLSGVDLGNTPSLLEGLLVEYAISSDGSVYGSYKQATTANLTSETLSATDGFYLRIRFTASPGMKYNLKTRNFISGETIKGVQSQATAVVDKVYDLATQGTITLTNITGTFLPGELIVRDSDGQMRATNVNTNTNFALFPSFTSYIDGFYLYTNVDQTAKYPDTQVYLSLTGLVAGTEVRVLLAGTQTEVAGIENSGTTFSWAYTYADNYYVDIVIHNLSYEYIRLTNILLTTSGVSIPVQQRVDRNYYNP